MTNLETANTHPSTATTRRATKTAPREGDGYWFYGDLAILRSPEGALPIIIEHHVSPGGAAPLHVHVDVDDSFYLLSGALALRSGDQTFLARAGDYVSLPQGVAHTLRVVGDEEAVMLQTHAAASFLDFIKAVGVPANAAETGHGQARLRGDEHHRRGDRSAGGRSAHVCRRGFGNRRSRTLGRCNERHYGFLAVTHPNSETTRTPRSGSDSLLYAFSSSATNAS